MSHKFSALLRDGQVLTDADYASASLLPLEQVVELHIEGVTLRADIEKGERVSFFTRHAVPIGNPDLEKLSVPVYEIRKDEKTLCRLYWHPTKGPLLSSQDLYF